ncbi:MAG TPA: hypothetical protein VGB03_01605, partial [Acidimicrobiales bacterium]
AATTGVGTSEVTTTVLNVQLGTDGSVLGIRLLGDDARSTIDPKVAAGEAFSRLNGVTVTSKTVDALNKTSGVSESKQPGGDADVTTGSVNLSQPAEGVTIPSAVLTGTIGLANLASEVGTGQAKSAIEATLTNASLAGGLVTASGVTSTVGTEALAAQSAATRSVKADQLVVVDLGSLLTGLNIDLTDLTIPTLASLLTTLNTTVGDVTGAQLSGVVADLQSDIDAVQAKITELDALSAVPGTVQTTADALNTLGTTLGLGALVDSSTVTQVNALAPGTAQVDALIDTLQDVVTELTDTLSGLISSVLTTLDSLALVKVTAVEVGVATKAADTVGNSAASIVAKIGSISVGNVTRPGTDVIEKLEEVNAKVKEVNDTIKGVLGGVDPGLADMVTVALFERAAGHGVSTADGYNKAVDGITALKATVKPPAALATIVSTIDAATGAGDLLASIGRTVPALSSTMKTLGTTTSLGTVGALSGGATVVVGSLGNTSTFAPQVSGTGTGTGTGTEGPRNVTAATGSNSTVPMTALAMLLIALGLGFREWVRMPAPRRTEQ